MDYGKNILNELLKEVRQITAEEYDKLHQEACLYAEAEEIIDMNFIYEVTFSQINHMEISEFGYKTDADVNAITASGNINTSTKEITIDQPDSSLAKAA